MQYYRRIVTISHTTKH